MDQLIQVAVDGAVTVAAAAIAYLSVIAVNFIKRKTGIEIEALHRESLHSAIMTGLMAFIENKRAGGSLKDFARDQMILATIDYVKRSVPDAIAALKPDDKILSDLIEAKITQSGAGNLLEITEKAKDVRSAIEAAKDVGAAVKKVLN